MMWWRVILPWKMTHGCPLSEAVEIQPPTTRKTGTQSTSLCFNLTAFGGEENKNTMMMKWNANYVRMNKAR
jgi:hypothetical protein